MNERNIGAQEPESVEREPISQTLREIAKKLGFIETAELQEVERQAIEASQALDSPETIERFNDLVAQIQSLGESIADQEVPKTYLSQIGLIAIRAATLFESNHLEDCRDEIYDILTALDNIARFIPEVNPSPQEIETLYSTIKKQLGETSKNQEPSPENKRAQIAEQNLQELARRREAGELEPTDYEVNYLFYLQQMDQPVTRKEVGNRAIVIKPEEFEGLGYLEIVLPTGEKIVLDFTEETFDKRSPLIIFPEELGEESDK